MPLTITKTKPVAKKPEPKVEAAALKLEDMTPEQLADYYGDLEDKVKAIQMRPEFAQFSEAGKELASRIEDMLQPEQSGDLKGEHYLLQIGAAARAAAQVKDMNALRKILGDKTFMAIATVTLTDVRKYCNPEQLAQVLDENTGYTKRRKIVSKFLG